tara:strand:+ start:3794 stop:3952 length:159 start_codon:yes stop_codon:yes gene_type:complete
MGLPIELIIGQMIPWQPALSIRIMIPSFSQGTRATGTTGLEVIAVSIPNAAW